MSTDRYHNSPCTVSIPHRDFTEDERRPIYARMGEHFGIGMTDLAARIRLAAAHFWMVSSKAKAVSPTMEVGWILPTPDGPLLGFLRGAAVDIMKADDVLSEFWAEPNSQVAEGVDGILSPRWAPLASAARASDIGGGTVDPSVVNSAGDPISNMFKKPNPADPNTLDSVPEGATYKKILATRVNVGRPVIDFTEPIHTGQNVDNIADGSTYKKTLATRVNAGRPVVDFSEAIHTAKNLDNITAIANTTSTIVGLDTGEANATGRRMLEIFRKGRIRRGDR